LVIKSFHFESIDVIKAKSCDSVAVATKIPARINFWCHFPKKQFGSQNWENILVVIGIDVTPPKVYLDHFGVGKSQPIAKNVCELVASVDDWFHFRHTQ